MNQNVAAFTGEGAYHGSTKPKAQTVLNPDGVPETMPTTIVDCRDSNATPFDTFTARFPNRYEVKAVLPVPSQAEIRNDGPTFVWTPFDIALRDAGPLTRQVLEAMERHIEGKKRFVYIDLKNQYFEAGDFPVDSRLFHVDGSITVRGSFAEDLGHPILHDMKARMLGDTPPPTYLAYQSSAHCATEFVVEPVEIELPNLIPNFDELDRRVRRVTPRVGAQPAGSIVRFDGRSLHRAVPATSAGWRLWVRLVETDRDVRVTPGIVDCYNTVYRTGT